MSLDYVPYDRSRQPGVLALMEAVWGNVGTPGEFDWWFEDGPEGEAVITLAVDGVRVVGVAAMAWMRLRIDGVEVRVPFPQYVATHPDYRGQGIFQRLQLESERRAAGDGADIALTFPNAATAPVFLGALGWTALRGPRVWVRPIRPFSLGRALVGRAADPPCSWPAGVGELRLGGLDVRRLHERPEGISELVGARDRTVTDAPYLEWRYFESPRTYRCFGAFDDRRLRGFAAVGRTTLHGVAGIALAELIVAEGDTRAARALLAACIREAGSGFDCMFAAGPLPALRSAYARSGFIPTPRRLRLLGKRLSGGGPLPSGLSFVLGDLDFV